MQNFTEIDPSTKVSDSLAAIMNNDKTALSNNAGSAFPTENLLVGMQCFRTDLEQTFVLKSLLPDVWEDVAATKLYVDNAIDAINTDMGDISAVLDAINGV